MLQKHSSFASGAIASQGSFQCDSPDFGTVFVEGLLHESSASNSDVDTLDFQLDWNRDTGNFRVRMSRGGKPTYDEWSILADNTTYLMDSQTGECTKQVYDPISLHYEGTNEANYTIASQEGKLQIHRFDTRTPDGNLQSTVTAYAYGEACMPLFVVRQDEVGPSNTRLVGPSDAALRPSKAMRNLYVTNWSNHTLVEPEPSTFDVPKECKIAKSADTSAYATVAQGVPSYGCDAGWVECCGSCCFPPVCINGPIGCMCL